MSTLNQIHVDVHHIGVSLTLIAIFLIVGALKYLLRALVPIGELVRLVFSALAVAMLLICSAIVLVAVLFVTARS